MKRPTIKEFLFGNFKKGDIFTDCSFIDKYMFSNYNVRVLQPHTIGKKCESIRKQLWGFKKLGIIREIDRVAKGCSDEIKYELVKTEPVVKQSTISKFGSKLKIFTVGK